MTQRDKEELMTHEMHAKDWNFDSSKTEDVVILLDLIATLRIKSRITNQRKAEVHMDNKEMWRSANTSTRFTNHLTKIQQPK